MDEKNRGATISLPGGFRFGAVPDHAPGRLAATAAAESPPGLGPLAAFVGNWTGSGFNTIFRPDNARTPTQLPIPIPVTDPPNDNILELNLTSENLAFSPSLGSVPNRGFLGQADIFLNGVPYLQTISDVTTPGQSIGIHVEPGLWMMVPSTTSPGEGPTLARMASIPHGTTIVAQGTSTSTGGPPTIPPVDITPFPTGGGGKIPFDSQTADKQGTPRIPQDLTAFLAAGTITQEMLGDPNTLLRNHIAGQKITATTEISIATSPTAPLFGGGTDNIAFLLGDAAASKPNAQALRMTATFWIETVEQVIEVPIYTPGQTPLTIPGGAGSVPGQPMPTFLVTPPVAITTPRRITVTSTQIQYSQQVMLNFNTLTWPHVSVATLVPADPIPVPPSAWD